MGKLFPLSKHEFLISSVGAGELIESPCTVTWKVNGMIRHLLALCLPTVMLALCCSLIHALLGLRAVFIIMIEVSLGAWDIYISVESRILEWLTSKILVHITSYLTSFLKMFQPAYQNLRQKVDNFVSTHLDKQEWNPTMNKNQLRNGLRQSVVQ